MAKTQHFENNDVIAPPLQHLGRTFGSFCMDEDVSRNSAMFTRKTETRNERIVLEKLCFCVDKAFLFCLTCFPHVSSPSHSAIRKQNNVILLVFWLYCSFSCLSLCCGQSIQLVFIVKVFWWRHRLPEHGKLTWRTSNFFACHGGSLSGHRYAQRDLLIGGC